LLFAVPDFVKAMRGMTLQVCTEKTYVYKTVHDVQLKLAVYSPEGTRSGNTRPAIVFFFGGGWTKGRLDQFEPQSKYLASLGMVAITADYRVYDRHQTTPFESVQDAKSAIAWTRNHAYDLGIDPQRIAAGGGSAGGHLAAATALIPGFADEKDAQRSEPNLLVLFNPVVDLVEIGFRSEALQRIINHLKDISPIRYVKPGLPPTIIFHGDQDTVVPIEQVERFCMLMKEAGNVCTLMPFAGRKHGFFNFHPDQQETMRMTIRFLQENGFLTYSV
jgi:acetyl esterase